MAAENENYLFAKMSTVLSYSIDGQFKIMFIHIHILFATIIFRWQ
jgi:hypothetical protein